MTPDERSAAARLVFEYLSPRDPAPASVDLIIGFGHFDPKIASHCCDLYRQFPSAQAIVFTGGLGAGTADLGRPEAQYFLELARAYAPEIQADKFVVEDRSTNTGENLAFTLGKIRELQPEALPGPNARSIALVANAYRQRRVSLTCQPAFSSLNVINSPPSTSFEEECTLFRSKNQDLVALLPGEIDRIITYGQKNWIRRENVPDGVLAACHSLSLAQT